jgi:hypothetical protein
MSTAQDNTMISWIKQTFVKVLQHAGSKIILETVIKAAFKL